MLDLFRWIEQTPLSLFVREDLSAYFILLIFHALGMAALVGAGMALSLRVLGVAAGARLNRFAALLPVMWIGAIMAVVSGVLLLAGYPAKALTNWVFFVKLVCLGTAGLLVWSMARTLFPAAALGDPLPASARWIAAAALLLWVAGVTCGKLLLYTNKMLTVS